MPPVSDVAKFIIQESDRISNLKLQKLLYYVQGWNLGLKDVKVFPEDIQAWVHGPVVPSMFHYYKTFGWRDIEKSGSRVSLPPSETKHVRAVLKAYGKFSGDQLERISHTESPWLETRKGLAPSDPSNRVLTPDLMRAYFGEKARSQA